MGWALRNTKRDRPRFLPSGGPGLSSVGFPSPGKPVPTMLRCLPAGLELRGRTVIASWAGRHIHRGRRCWDRACVRACVCACACVCLAHRRHTQLCLPPAEPAFGLLGLFVAAHNPKLIYRQIRSDFVSFAWYIFTVLKGVADAFVSVLSCFLKGGAE